MNEQKLKTKLDISLTSLNLKTIFLLCRLNFRPKLIKLFIQNASILKMRLILSKK